MRRLPARGLYIIKVSVKHLRSEISAGLHIRTDSLHRFVHLNYLFEDVVFLLFFNNCHDGSTVLDEVLLPLNLERAHLLQMV